MEDLQTLSRRLERHLTALSAFTATPGRGVTRLPFTPEARAAVDYLRTAMTEAGMTVRVDQSGAVIGRLEGEDPDAPVIMLGSHYDSVRSGGAYDGAAGVVAAIETARLVRASGAARPYPIEVIATNDEEGIAYGVCFVSSKALLGRWTPEELRALHDEHGESLYDGLRRFGCDPERIGECRIDPARVKCFLEVHIEQGPVLDQQGIRLGPVECIAGLRRVRVVMTGEANHAGSTPMPMRRDAVEAAARVIAEIPGWAREEGGGTVATVGHIVVTPNALNTIAREVEWVIDCRAPETARMERVLARMDARIREVCAETGVQWTCETLVSVEPRNMDAALVELLEQSCVRRGHSCRRMLSGATHDAHLLAEAVDTAMLFIPSRGGISHAPEEFSDCGDLAAAVQVVTDAVLHIEATPPKR